MEKYVKNMKKFVENMKEYEEICRYIGSGTPTISFEQCGIILTK